MRQQLVVGNWKMHGSPASVRELMQGLAAVTTSTEVETVVCPSFVHLAMAIDLSTDARLAVGAQDCSHMQSGAYTGEVAPQMLADLGCEWVILGHSERRQYHGESDALIAQKLKAALAAKLQPILCVGETREQRESGQAEQVVAAQLSGALAELDSAELVIAYEPVWAIGTGLTASPEEAQAMHAFVREHLNRIPALNAESTPLLYGGSVKADNAAQLFAQADIDGALVGGASLKSEEFLSIVAAAA